MNFRIQYVLGVGEARTGDIGYKYFYEASALMIQLRRQMMICNVKSDTATVTEHNIRCDI